MKRFKRILRRCAALLLCAMPLAAGAQDRRLEPVDEAAKDPSWVSFRERLLDAVRKRDRKFVLSVLDRNVRGNLDGPRGVEGFREQWSLDAEDSPLWRALPSALQLGSAYVKRDDGLRELCAPYVLARWPRDVDPFKHGVIVSREVPVRAEPSHAARAIQALSYDIVAVTDWEVADRSAGAKQLWVRIRVRNGEGYIREEQIRSPIEHSACFVKTGDGWRLTGLAPGGG